MKFLDLAQVHIRSGSGGAGCVAFRREKHLEFGGPDGGDGGRGGDVRVEVAPGLNTLVDFRYRPHVFAKNGQSGMGKGRTGRSGAEAVLRVPPGTEILEDDRETVIADLTKAGDSVVLAQGGNGGFGNLHFRTATNQAPRRANPGQPGVERTLWLRLKLIADAGLVGLPNAGKSTFLAAVSNARPRVADYPFTTLQPNLGVAAVDDSELVIADLPGLIEGAHTGRGIGDRFLGHVERAPVLLHLVDATAEAPLADYRAVEVELAHHSDRHADKPRVTALTKTDAVPAGTTADLCAELSAAAGAEVHAISAVSGAGVAEVLRALRTAIEAARKCAHADDAEPAPWRP